jgi:hypothetical protein
MNIIGEVLVRMCPEITPSFLDGDNILWEVVEDKWIGKRSVWTFDNRACWLEDTTLKNIKSWWCGENADYNEGFYN